MRKRLSIVFAIQSVIFTTAIGYDQLTQGGIRTFLSQKDYSTGIVIILFWILPFVITISLETIFQFGKWSAIFIKNKYIFWQLSKRKIPSLSHKELLRVIYSANQRGLLKLDEMEKLEKLVKDLDSIDILLLEFLDNPFAVSGYVTELQERKSTYYSLFRITFPFFSKQMEELIRPSILKLFQLELITINFDDFKAKVPENFQKTYSTSPLGHKLIYLVKKVPSYL